MAVLRRSRGERSLKHPQPPPHLLAHAEALLVAEDNTRVRTAGGHVLAVQVHEVAHVERVEDTSLFGRVSGVLLVGPPDQSGLQRRLDVSAAQAEGLHLVVYLSSNPGDISYNST